MSDNDFTYEKLKKICEEFAKTDPNQNEKAYKMMHLCQYCMREIGEKESLWVISPYRNLACELCYTVYLNPEHAQGRN